MNTIKRGICELNLNNHCKVSLCDFQVFYHVLKDHVLHINQLKMHLN